ncbi:MAG: type VI secretion system baseplate subunit TssF [Bacteroidetes bacterium]|nr:type VI secretion system baseplate subunit TssF [Bacteroidota bacterium]
MIKNAAKIWGGNENDDPESSFDPIVTMFIDACASELYKINSEIRSSQSRILNRLAQILSPEALIGPQPSHAIAHARPTDPTLAIDPDIQFYSLKRISSNDSINKEINKEIFFSPLTNYKLFDGDIKYAASSNLLFEYKSPISRQNLSDGFSTDKLDPSVLWIGIELNTRVNSLQDMSFYFDWKNDSEQDQYLHMLPLTKWTINNEFKEVVAGIGTESKHQNSLSETLTEQENITLQTKRKVEDFYKSRFYTLIDNATDENSKLERSSYPSEFTDIFSPQVLSKIQGNCVWIKLQFSTAFPANAISDLYLSINSYPVINKKLNKLIYRLQNNLNIVPLSTEDLFFDLGSVQNSEGKPFISNPMSSGFKNESGYYTLRYGGLERFDERQATEMLTTVLDLLRDENAAFSSLGNDFINTYIRQISQALAMIENRIELKGQKKKPDYFLLINPFIADENIYVRFTTTNGNNGNHVKAGSKLINYSGTEVRPESLMFISASTGGKDALNENERIMAYKKAMLSHDRIVTEQDIRLACFHELGTLVKNVIVKKSWKAPLQKKQGIQRILEVILYPSKSQQLSQEEWADLARGIKSKIELQSTGIIPLNIVIYNEN